MKVATGQPGDDIIGVVDMVRRIIRILTLAALLFLVDVSVAQGDTLPESAYISGVNGHAQKHSLSCEARSAADLATFWGIRIGENEFLEALPRSGNPDTGFVGNPNDAWGNIPPNGYGVYAGPVADTLRTFGLQAEAHNNLSWDDLREEIHAGHPVIVWIIGQMWNGTSVRYTAPDGSSSRVAYYEHTMILTGYNRDTVQVVDAYSGQYQTYGLSAFLHSWQVLGNMAVFTSLEAGAETDISIETQSETYSVQPGDYLIELANRFGTSWEKLAQLNSISYPYVIQPGQVLQVPGNDAPKVINEKAQPETVQKTVNYNLNCIIRLPMVQRLVTPSMLPPH
jgi:uncharacterized protein YvpB